MGCDELTWLWNERWKGCGCAVLSTSGGGHDCCPHPTGQKTDMEGLGNYASVVQPGFEPGQLLTTKTIFHSPQPQVLQPCKPITSLRCPPSKAETPASAQRYAHAPPQSASCLECCLSEHPVHLQFLLLAESHTWRLNSRSALHSANKHKALSCLLCAGTMSSALFMAHLIWDSRGGRYYHHAHFADEETERMDRNLSTVIQPVNDRPESHITQPGANLVLLTTELRCLREGEGHSCRENPLGEVGSDLDGCWEGYSRQSGPTE